MQDSYSIKKATVVAVNKRNEIAENGGIGAYGNRFNDYRPINDNLL